MTENASPGGNTVWNSVEALETEREQLERRLTEGYVKIEAALIKGQDVDSWERFWIELLHEYEVVCSQLDAA